MLKSQCENEEYMIGVGLHILDWKTRRTLSNTRRKNNVRAAF